MEPIKKILRTPSALVLLLVALVSLVGIIIKSISDTSIAKLPIEATLTAEAKLTEAAITLPIPSETPSSFICRPLLWSENFDGNSNKYEYHWSKNPIEIINNKLRFTLYQAPIGESLKLFGQYETFSLEFEAYPVGEIFDTSVNISFLQHGDGGYEFQIRPRYHSYNFLHRIGKVGQQEEYFSTGWIEDSNIDFGEKSMLVRLNVQIGEFALFINNNKITTISDPNPYLRGEVFIGMGTGETAPSTIDIDNIRICGN